MRAHVQGRALSNHDVTAAHDGASFSIVATPRDGARIDPELTVPYRYLVRMVTTHGGLSYEGLGKAELQTDPGAVSLRFPE